MWVIFFYFNNYLRHIHGWIWKNNFFYRKIGLNGGAECSKLNSDWGCMIRSKFPMDTRRGILIGQLWSTRIYTGCLGDIFSQYRVWSFWYSIPRHFLWYFNITKSEIGDKVQGLAWNTFKSRYKMSIFCRFFF